MAQTIKLKRSAVAAKEPGTGDLALGELAINTYDGKMYFKKDSGTAAIVRLANIGEVVELTGNQSISGIKKFSTSVGLNVVRCNTDAINTTVFTIHPPDNPNIVGSFPTIQFANNVGVYFGENATVYFPGTAFTTTLLVETELRMGQAVLNQNAGGKNITFYSGSNSTFGGAIHFGKQLLTGESQTFSQGIITNLKDPTNTYDAANKNYVDTRVLDNLSDVVITSPTSGQVLKYNGTNWINDTDATGGGSTNVSTDAIWDAKGDLAVATGADTAAKLSVGTNGHVLMADSAQTTGVKWAEVVSLDGSQQITGSKIFSATYTNITGTLATKDIQLSGSTVGKTLFFSTNSTATNGGTIIFGTDNGANAQATPKGSIQNLGSPVNDNDAARKKYVDDQVATKANVSHTHNASDIDAGTLSVIRGGTGQSSFVNGELLIGNTTGNTLAKATLTGTPNRLLVTNGAGSITLNVDATDANTVNKVVARNASGDFSAGTITAALSGNATTATTLQTARTLTIGSSGKTFNGDANVTWSLAEIGAAADSAVVKLTGDQTIAGTKTFSSDGYFNEIKFGKVNGTNNVVIGNANTGRGFSSSNNNLIAIGADALNNPTANAIGNNNVAIGPNAMKWYGSLSTPGTENYCVGSGTLQFATTGIRNCALGTLALTSIGSGSSNVGVGFYALQSADSGSNNIGIGAQSGGAITSGGSNVCIGSLSLSASNGSTNVAVGNHAGWKQNNGSTDASGLNNCVFIGASTRSNGSNQSNQIVIGFQALGEGTDTTVIGNEFTLSTHLEGCLKRNAPVTKTANFTLAARENWVINNKLGSSCTVTLPAASAWTGREVMFKNIQAQTLVSASSNVVPRAGGAAGTAILAATAGAWATLVSDGTNWIIMQGS